MRYCASCEYNDGCVYTSLPPQYKCTITGEFHFGDDPCSVEFAPVKHGRWEEKEVIHYGQTIEEWQSAKCSVCGRYHTTPFTYYFKYCPNCGARMDGEENG